MRNLFAAAKLLLLDMASTFLFVVLLLLTNNIPLSVILGVALGVAQIGWEFARKKPIDTMPVSYTHLDVYKRQGASWKGHHRPGMPGR